MIISCGEALIDMLPRETSDGEACYLPVAGGAVFNTAIALGRLGAPSGFFAGISSDFFGDILLRTLEESKVDTRYVVRSDNPETLAFVRLVNGHAQYAFYDEGTAGRLLAQNDIPDLDDNVTALQFGAISLIPEPCGATYEEMMRREHLKRVISFDPNIRTSFIKDKPKHRARMERMLAMSDIVKLSDEDLVFFDAGGDFDGFAAGLLKGKAKLVVMTRGADGAVAIGKSGKVEVPGVKVSVVDTVGAGDTVNAGILAWLHKAGKLNEAGLGALTHADIASALGLAVRAAAVTVSRAGANPPWLHELAA
ncbi:MAG: carbohydrate kinase family protein [Rhizobiaceae bacterium]